MPEPNRDWVRGLADRSCQIVERDRAIVLTSTEGSTLAMAYHFLRSIDVPCRITWRDQHATLRVGGLEALVRWKNEVGFNDPEKARQLDEVIRAATEH